MRAIRLVGALVAGLAGLGALGAGHWRARRAEREYEVRAARTAAAYLAVVTPTAGDSDYQLGELLVQARGLAGLPGWSGTLEVYHGTAPLVHATAPPLDPRILDRLREVAGGRPMTDGMLVPLEDRGARVVVGAVLVRASIAPGILNAWTLSLLSALCVTGAVAPASRHSRRVIAAGALAAGLVGVTAYRQARLTARTGTDRWLGSTRVALEAAAARQPVRRSGIAAARLAPIALDAELVATDSGSIEVRRTTVGGQRRAETRVRLAPRRWLRLRMRQDDSGFGKWSFVTFGLAALGPLGMLLVRPVARSASSPHA